MGENLGNSLASSVTVVSVCVFLKPYFSAKSSHASPSSLTTPKREFDFGKQFLSPTRMKSQLQEELQRNGMPIPHYTDVKKTGPAHLPTFTVKLDILSDRNTVVWTSTGVGSSKASAESNVAKKGLDHVTGIIEKDGDLFHLKASLGTEVDLSA